MDSRFPGNDVMFVKAVIPAGFVPAQERHPRESGNGQRESKSIDVVIARRCFGPETNPETRGPVYLPVTIAGCRAWDMLYGHGLRTECPLAMNKPATTMYTGPLGSTIHVLRADADTIAELAAIDWNRHFRRVCLDPVRGIITLMSPSHPHEDLGSVFDDIVNATGSALVGAVKKLRSPRLRGRDEPPGTGMEPDCAFYVGERARGYRTAFLEGDAAALAYAESTAPDLVVEIELTNADEGKARRYGELGVREMWRLRGIKSSLQFQVEFLALGSGTEPRRIDASVVLEGLTPDDACEAADGVRRSLTPEEAIEAVTRVVQRRQRASVRVREEETAYHS